MTIEKFSIPDTDLVIWAEPPNLNYFLENDIEPDTAAGVTNEQMTVPSHNRRQYVGDSTPISIEEYQRTVMIDPGRKSGAAIPGKPFIVDDGLERRQMRYTGPFVQLHAFFNGDNAMALSLYSPTGTRYTIAAPVPQIAKKK